MKTCPRCKKSKQAADFNRRWKDRLPHRLASYCRQCEKERYEEQIATRGPVQIGGWRPNRKSRIERFRERYEVDEATGCWNWTGRKNAGGYGVVVWKPFNLIHRYSYATFNGEIPAGMDVLHRCDNPACVNPEHLWLGNDHDNANDRREKGRGVCRERVHPGKSVTVETAQKIHEEAHSGFTCVQLAQKYSISATYVSEIRLKKTWHFREDANRLLPHSARR